LPLLAADSTVRRLPSALRTFNTQTPWTKSASAIQIENQSGIVPETYSHSIVNELSKLLICRRPDAAMQKFTVTFTVKARSASIGAGLRAVLRRLTFRDLSRTIDSWVARERFTGTST
jgi:hypothetical protein